jgi:hypothetical protein
MEAAANGLLCDAFDGNWPTGAGDWNKQQLAAERQFGLAMAVAE